MAALRGAAAKCAKVAVKKQLAASAGSDAWRTAQRVTKLVHLIDALPYVFRAYYSLPGSIRDPQGRQSNAVVGFANFVMKYITDEKPTHIALCFDGSVTSCFRNDMYPAYKSNRPSPPSELMAQIGRCREFAEALGIACFDVKAYEADDLIGTIGTSLSSDGHKCVVVTNDKDLCQLVGPMISVYDFAKGKRYDEAGVVHRMGVKPSQVVDLLGLMGDAVDCIPGVKGIGSKTASCLLKSFANLESLYANLDAVESLPIRGATGIRKKLASQKEMAFLSRKLATLVCKVPLRTGGLRGLQRRRLAKGPLTALHRLLDRFGLARLHDRVDAMFGA